MCLSNIEEPKLKWGEWLEMFPDGFPEFSIGTNILIDTQASSPNIAKASVKDFQQWATSKNAEIVARAALCQARGDFPLLKLLLPDDRGGTCHETEKETDAQN